MKRYPMIEFMVRHGRRLAIAGAIVPALLGVASAVRFNEPLWLLAGAIGAAGSFIVLRSLAERVEVIAETLLPR